LRWMEKKIFLTFISSLINSFIYLLILFNINFLLYLAKYALLIYKKYNRIT
jgi:hypothetical protein